MILIIGSTEDLLISFRGIYKEFRAICGPLASGYINEPVWRVRFRRCKPILRQHAILLFFRIWYEVYIDINAGCAEE